MLLFRYFSPSIPAALCQPIFDFQRFANVSLTTNQVIGTVRLLNIGGSKLLRAIGPEAALARSEIGRGLTSGLSVAKQRQADNAELA